MTDFPYARAFVNGVITGVSLSIFIFYMIKPNTQPITPIASKGIFTVIDHYNGCDVVQYQYGLLSEYKYFLDCKK